MFAVTNQQNSWLQLVVWFGIFLAIFYFFIILPNKKKEKKHSEVIDNLRKGDKVVTIGGIKGEVAKVKEDSIVIRVSDNTELEFIKSAIGYKVEE
ncbi:MAG TPA: preprotein translocase subunit YajC [Syntrophomonadaceae bacterium]|nr:preprotein translocase subunit YajC [Syntrophomonadaceae bacterium]